MSCDCALIVCCVFVPIVDESFSCSPNSLSSQLHINRETVPKDSVKIIRITLVNPVILERSDQDPGQNINKTVKLNLKPGERHNNGIRLVTLLRSTSVFRVKQGY